MDDPLLGCEDDELDNVSDVEPTVGATVPAAAAAHHVQRQMRHQTPRFVMHQM
jgi:hypothetical protein